MMPSPNLEGGAQRWPARAPGTPAPDRDALHALLAIASSAQLELRKPPSREEPALAGAGEGAAPAPRPEPAPRDALQRMAESVRAVTEASGVAIAVARGGQMVCVASTGACAIAVGTSIDLDRGLAGKCARSGELQNCPDAENDPCVNQEACRELGVRSMVMLPLRRRRRTLAGLLAVFSGEPAHFSPRHLRFLEFMAGLALEAAEHERPEPPAAPAPVALEEAAAVAAPRWGLRIAGIGLPLAVAVGALLWESLPALRSRLLPPASTVTSVAAPQAGRISPGSQSPAIPAAGAPAPAALPAAAPEGGAHLTAVSYASALGVTRVVLELDRAVRYRARRLDHPARLFLDLEDTRLTLAGRNLSADDPLLASIRIAQNQSSVARVVLDLKSAADYTATQQSAPPRLIIELRAPADR